jgi:hypothetical protein
MVAPHCVRPTYRCMARQISMEPAGRLYKPGAFPKRSHQAMHWQRNHELTFSLYVTDHAASLINLSCAIDDQKSGPTVSLRTPHDAHDGVNSRPRLQRRMASAVPGAVPPWPASARRRTASSVIRPPRCRTRPDDRLARRAIGRSDRLDEVSEPTRPAFAAAVSHVARRSGLASARLRPGRNLPLATDAESAYQKP